MNGCLNQNLDSRFRGKEDGGKAPLGTAELRTAANPESRVTSPWSRVATRKAARCADRESRITFGGASLRAKHESRALSPSPEPPGLNCPFAFARHAFTSPPETPNRRH